MPSMNLQSESIGLTEPPDAVAVPAPMGDGATDAAEAGAGDADLPADSSSTFRGRLLELAGEYEKLEMENVALKEKLGLTTDTHKQQGKGAEGCAALAVYEVDLDVPLLPSTPEGTEYKAMLEFDQEVPPERGDDVVPMRHDRNSYQNGAWHAGIDLEFPLTPKQAAKEVTSSMGAGLCRFSASACVEATSSQWLASRGSRPSCEGQAQMAQIRGGPRGSLLSSASFELPFDETRSFLPGFERASPHLQNVFEMATMRALGECYIRAKDPCLISPLSYRRIVWDGILFSCILFEIWVTPFELLFLRTDALPKTYQDLSMAMTLVFVADIFANFNTGYINRGEVVMKRVRIAREYMSGWFWIDLFSSIPFDLLFSSFDSTGMRMVKFGKALRILRAARYVRVTQSYSKQRTVVHNGKGSRIFAIVKPSIPFVILTLAGHVHTCMLAAVSNHELSWTLVDALQDYYKHFSQAWTCLFMGIPVDTASDRIDHAFLFNLLVSVERICFLAVGGVWAVVYARTHLSEYMQMVAEKESAIQYLKSHSISTETQLQFKFGLEEMASARLRQNHYRNIVERSQLTEELQRRICNELWAARLMSFGLITQIAAINPDSEFIMELCLLVREEVFASKAVLFQYGDSAIAAYCVITGRLNAVKVIGYLPTQPDYEAGHWIGETALVNPLLRRSLSVITKSMSELMAVPADSFQKLLTRLGLVDDFHEFIQAHLWKGLCARCGVLGDHFADACPGVKAHRYTRADMGKRRQSRGLSVAGNVLTMISTSASTGVRSWGSALVTAKRTMSQVRSGKAMCSEHSWSQSQTPEGMASDLWRFLREQNVVFLKEHLKELQIKSLDDLLQMDVGRLERELPEYLMLTEQEWKKISPKEIERFLSRAAKAVHKQIFSSVTDEHYIFLSHAKLESGTEAALMRTELECMICDDKDSTLNDFAVPVFLDSEDLKSLSDLQELVHKTHNLVLLLSPTVLQRVWVLVEIATAQKEGVRVVPVHISKPGTSFEFPKDEFYEKLRNGETLTLSDKGILETAKITLQEVEVALRSVFKEIAVPYSPHMSSHMRRAQLECLMKRCRLHPSK